MKEEKKIKVSLFENYQSAKPIGEVDLLEHVLSSRWKTQVEAIRRESDKEKRGQMKMSLPSVTTSGTFKKRCVSGLIQHSGVICIDIDAKENPHAKDWDNIKTTISHLPGLWYAGFSASGNGLFALFRLKYPEKHKEHFSALTMDLKRLGITVDQSGSDVCRLRGVSYDEQPFYNPSAFTYDKYRTITHNPTSIIATSPATSIQNPDTTSRRVNIIVAKIEASGIDITNDYNDWFAIGRSLAAEFGEYGRTWFHLISRQYGNYNHQQCGIQYSRCLKTCSRTSIATFFGICKKYGLYAK